MEYIEFANILINKLSFSDATIEDLLFLLTPAIRPYWYDVETPFLLDSAITNRRVNLVKSLLNKYTMSQVGLNAACAFGFEEFFQIPNFPAPNQEGIDMATKYGQTAILKLAKSPPSVAALDEACCNGHFGVVEYCVDQLGIYPSTTGINLAVQNGRDKILEFLFSKPEKKLPNDNLAVYWACKMGYVPIIKLLLAEGYKFDKRCILFAKKEVGELLAEN